MKRFIHLATYTISRLNGAWHEVMLVLSRWIAVINRRDSKNPYGNDRSLLKDSPEFYDSTH